MSEPRCPLCRGRLGEGRHEIDPPSGLTVSDTTALCVDAQGQFIASVDDRPAPFTIAPVRRRG